MQITSLFRLILKKIRK